MKTFKDQLHLPVTMIDDSARMLAELKVSSLCHILQMECRTGSSH